MMHVMLTHSLIKPSAGRRICPNIEFHRTCCTISDAHRLRHLQPVADILYLLQCLVTGMLVLVKMDDVPGQGVCNVIRALPKPEWLSSNYAQLSEIFGVDHYRKLFRTAQDRVLSFKLEPAGEMARR